MLLATILVVEGCSSQLSGPTPSTAQPPSATSDPPTQSTATTDDHKGIPTWAWVTAGVVVVATTIALVFVYVIVPKVAENAGKAAGNACCANSGSNGGGLLPLGS